MEKNITYKINLTSEATKNSLSDEQLNDIFKCFFCKEYQNFRNSILEEDKKYDEFSLAKWQLAKAKEIEELWHNNIDYTIDNENVKVSVNFNVDLPKSWDKDDIIIWTEGFDRLNKVLLMYQMEKLTASNSTYHVYKNENDFLHRLSKNQKFNIEKN